MDSGQANETWAATAGLSDASASITVEQLDAYIKEYVEAREIYEAAKEVSSEKYNLLQHVENKCMEALKAVGKKSYKLEGVGLFSRVMKEVVTTPKTIEDKRELFCWIGGKYGTDVLDDMLSINHNKLNSFYNEEVEKAKDPLFKIPGIGAPTYVENVSFRKESKK
jgi:hypothetical protein